LEVAGRHDYHLAMPISKRPITAAKPTRRPRSSAYGAATTIDEYLARVEPEQRAALEALRQVIRKAAPKAEEVITYGIPAPTRRRYQRHRLPTLGRGWPRSCRPRVVCQAHAPIGSVCLGTHVGAERS
jgi:hypothetical protein